MAHSHSTPSGLSLFDIAFPRFHLGLFTFNPFGVGVLI